MLSLSTLLVEVVSAACISGLSFPAYKHTELSQNPSLRSLGASHSQVACECEEEEAC